MFKVEGNFPEISFDSKYIQDVFDVHYQELRSDKVYFVAYRVWRKAEYGLLCSGTYINVRAGIIESYEDFCTRVLYNNHGKLSMKVANNTLEEFQSMYKSIKER